MRLSQRTMEILRGVDSVNKKDGFQSHTEVRNFWNRYGPKGFLNIKEITPKIVREIRQKVIEAREN